MSDLKKWFPFRFNRVGRRPETRETASDKSSTPLARRQDYYDPFTRMEREMNQMMRSVFGGDDWFLPAFRQASRSPSWFGNFAPERFTPSIDVTDETNHLVVSAELPGMDRDDIEVTVDDNTLTLKGEKKHEFENDEQGVFRSERYYGKWQRSLPLPAGVDTDGGEANFERGVLTVKFPKIDLQEKEGPRRIELS